MESLFITYKSSTIHYCKAGNGEKILLCFHGYSQTSSVFSFIEKKIENDFTIIAIDFPFHGKTIWNEGLNFTADTLMEIINQIINELSLPKTKMYLLGFSMGGRIALSMMQQIPDKIEKLLLIAPDGMKVNIWYRFATQNKIGNKFFKTTMQHPAPMFGFLKTVNKLGLVNPSVFKFVTYYINDKKVRDDLYKRWTTMRSFKPKIKKIKSIIKENKISVRLLYGEFDKIIRVERAEKFMKGMEPFCRLRIVSTGHYLLIDANADAILKMLKN